MVAELAGFSPEHRAVMRALMATGHYDETPDGFEWLWRDAEGCLVAAEAADVETAVAGAVAHLVDAGLHPDDCDEGELDCLEHDARTAVDAAQRLSVRARRSEVE